MRKPPRLEVWTTIISIAVTLALLLTFLPIEVGVNDGILSISLRQASANPDWLTGWPNRISHNLTGATGAGTDYQIKINAYETFPDYGVDFTNSFVKYGSNPILQQGAATTWDEFGIRENQLLVDKYGNIELEDSKYVLYYSGKNDAGDTAIGRATFTRSEDKTTISNMTKYGSNPVLNLTDMGWDDPQGAMGGACVIKLASDSYIMYLWGRASGGNNAVYYATSSDGLDWTANLTSIVSISGHGLTIVCARELQYGANAGRKVMFFEYDATSIYYYYSDVGWTSNWTSCGSNPVFDTSDVSWDTEGAVANPIFTELGDGEYVIGFNGKTGTSAPMWQGGFAKSTDLTSWTDSGAIRLPCGTSGQWDDGRVETLVLVKDDLGSELVGLFYFGIPTTDNVEDGAIGYATIDQSNVLCLEGKCTNFPTDIAFTDNNGYSELYHWAEDLTASPVVYWVKVTDSLESGTVPIYVYCGKSGGNSSYYSGPNTFIQFDDFERDGNGDAIGGSWTIIQGDADISTEQAYSDTRSGKIIDNDPVTAITRVLTAGTTYAIRFRLYKETLADFYFSHGDGTERLVVKVPADEDIDYYNGASQDTGANLAPDDWELIELTDINHATPKFDIWQNDSKIKDDADMYANSAVTNLVQINQAVASTGGDFYIDNFIVRKWAAIEPTHGAWGEWETLSAEITNTPDNYGFGILQVGTSSNTSISYFSINNTGNCAVDVTIQGTDATGGDDTWTLSDTATAGENIYGLKAGLDDADDTFDVIVKKTATYNTLVSNLAEDATQDWGLKIWMPTSLSGYDNNEMTGTITLVASEAS